MPTVFNRMPDEVQFVIITGVLITCLFAVIPHHFEKAAYRDTPAVSYEKYKDQAGYPAGSGFTDVKSVADMESLNNFVITVDAKDITPTHKYMSILGRSYFGGIGRVNQNCTEHGIGQYYTVILESGEKIIVFLDDFAVEIPKEGKVTLPVGRIWELNTIDDTFREIQKEQGISEENIKWYVDAAGEWRNSEQAKAINDKKFFRGILIFLLVAAIEIIIFKIDKMKHE